jgi:predicted nucleotidyltransferase
LSAGGVCRQFQVCSLERPSPASSQTGAGLLQKCVVAETPFPWARALGTLKGVITLGILFERREQIRHLAERYRAGNVRVFGSVARGNNTGASDVDLLVTPRAGCSLFDLGGLLEDLQDLLGCRVDLVTEDGLKARLRERVLREAVPL